MICKESYVNTYSNSIKKTLKPQTEISGIFNASLLGDYVLVSFNLLVKSVKNLKKNQTKTPKLKNDIKLRLDSFNIPYLAGH